MKTKLRSRYTVLRISIDLQSRRLNVYEITKESWDTWFGLDMKIKEVDRKLVGVIPIYTPIGGIDERA